MNYFKFLLLYICIVLSAPSVSAIEAPTLKLASNNRTIDLSFNIDNQSAAWLVRKNKLRVGITSFDFPPFAMSDSDHQLRGITAEYLLGLQKALHIQVEMQFFTSREQAFAALMDGKVDLIDISTIAEANKYGAVLTDAYSYTHLALYSKAGALLDVNPSSAKSKISTAEQMLISDDLITRFGNANVEKFQSPTDAISAVLLDNAEVYLGDTVTSGFLISQNFSNLLVINTVLRNTDKEIGFAMRDGDVVLKNLINRALATRSSCQKTNDINWWVASIRCYESSVPENLSAEQQRLLMSNKVIRISISEDLAPYAFFDSLGQFKGALSDILEKIRLETGLKFSIVRTISIAEAIQALDDHQVDLSLLTETEQRKHKYLFSAPIFDAPYSLITRSEKASTFMLLESDNKILAIPKSDALEDYVRKRYPKLNLKFTNTTPDALKEVRDGGADFAIISTNQARYFLSYKFQDSLAVASIFKPRSAHVAFAAAPSEEALIAILTEALAKVSPGERALITARWQANSATDALYWEGVSLRVYQVLSALFLMLLITCVWIVGLRKVIFKRSIERKELQLRLKLKQNMVNSIPHPIYVRSLDGSLLLFNNSYAKVFHQDANSTSSAGFLDDLVDPLTFRQWRVSYSNVLQTGIAIAADQTLPAQNKNLDIYHWIEPLRDDNERIVGVVCGWLDISDRLKILEELQQAKSVADDASKSKSIFLATVSHEIRTPMNAIIGMLELVLARDKSTDRDHKAIEVAYSSAVSLLELLGNILDASSIESGQTHLQLEVTTWRQIIEPVIEVFNGSAKQKNLLLVIELDQYADELVTIDKFKVKQVLSNLLSNAIKFTDVGNIKVALTGVPQDDSIEFRMVVQDHGTGIDEPEKATLFKPFSYIKTTKNSGAGLGLSICHSLSLIMGGTLQVASTKGEGTSVTLSLLLERGLLNYTPHIDSVARIAPTGTTSMSILIAEDHLPSLHLLKEQLELLGHEVILAHNGLDALCQWEHSEVDIIITDCNMPELDGAGLAREIRAREQDLQVRPSIIIGLTANTRKEDIQKCLVAGMDHCFVKPLNLSLLSRFVPDLRNDHAQSEQPLADFLHNFPLEKQHDLINKLVTTNEIDYKTLELALSTIDLLAMEGALHKIKSSARILGASDLLDLCEKFEQAIEATASPLELEARLVELKRNLGNLHRNILAL